MPDDKGPGRQQPEFERGLEAAAKAGGQKRADQSETATSETEPTPASLDHKQAEAADILKRNAEKDTGSPT